MKRSAALLISAIMVFAICISAFAIPVSAAKSANIAPKAKNDAPKGYNNFTANLFDGIADESGDYTDIWFGYYKNNTASDNYLGEYPVLNLTLDKVYDVSRVRAHVYSSGRRSASTLEGGMLVEYSLDGSTYYRLGLSAPMGSDIIDWAEVSSEAVAKYIRITFRKGSVGTVFLLNEVEVYGIEHEEDPPVVKEGNIAPLAKADVPKSYGNYSANLFDGRAHNAVSYDSKWFAYYQNGNAAENNFSGRYPVLNLEFESVYNIKSVKANIWSGGGDDGIAACNGFLLEYSLDGKNYFTCGRADGMTDVNEIAWREAKTDVIAKYIRITFLKGSGSYLFLNEVEVYGEEASYLPVDEDEIISVDGVLDDNAWANAPTGTVTDAGLTASYKLRADDEYLYIALIMQNGANAVSEADLMSDFDTAVKKGSRLRLWIGGGNDTVAGYFDILLRTDGSTAAYFKKAATENIIAAVKDNLFEIAIPRDGDVKIDDTLKLNINYSDVTGGGYAQLNTAIDITDYWAKSANYPVYDLASMKLFAIDRSLPEGAIAITQIGYPHGNATGAVIFAGGGRSIGELTLEGYGQTKDPVYWTMLVVNEHGFVIDKLASGESKKDYICPEDCYIIGAWNDASVADTFEKVTAIGLWQVIELYNLDLISVFAGGKYVTVENAAFTARSLPAAESALEIGYNEVECGKTYAFAVPDDCEYMISIIGSGSYIIYDAEGNIYGDTFTGESGKEIYIGLLGLGTVNVTVESINLPLSETELVLGEQIVELGFIYKFTAKDDGRYAFGVTGAGFTLLGNDGEALSDASGFPAEKVDLKSGEEVFVKLEGRGAVILNITLEEEPDPGDAGISILVILAVISAAGIMISAKARG